MTIVLILLALQIPGALIVGWFLDHAGDDKPLPLGWWEDGYHRYWWE